MAPAVTVDLFADKMYDHVVSKRIPCPTIYMLSDEAENGDTVGLYGKSLLYLVSNAFEPARGTPILGMEKFVTSNQSAVLRKVAALFSGKDSNRYNKLVIADHSLTDYNKSPNISCSTSHGGFDNDEFTMNSVLHRILGVLPPPKKRFSSRDLAY